MPALPLLLLASALAEEPADDEMVVEEKETPAEAREEVEAVMDGLGYKPQRRTRRDGRKVYRPTAVRGREGLRPTLVIDDDGFVFIRGRSRRTVANSWSGNYRRQQEIYAEVFGALHPSILAWRAAIQHENMEARYYQIPDQLAATWEVGAPLGGHPAGPTPEARRAALLAFWASRTHTPEGDRVRQITADFLSYVVQGSPWPITAEEKAAAEATCQCGPLEL